MDCIIALDASADSQVSRPIVHETLDLAEQRPQDLWFTRAEGTGLTQKCSCRQLTVCRTRGEARPEDVAPRRYLADSGSPRGRGCREGLRCP